jgi:hypothetical protein
MSDKWFVFIKMFFLMQNCEFWELLLVCALAKLLFHGFSPNLHRILISRLSQLSLKMSDTGVFVFSKIFGVFSQESSSFDEFSSN